MSLQSKLEKMSPEDRRFYFLHVKKALAEKSCDSILEFGKFVEPSYRPGKFHVAVSKFIDDFVENKVKKLIIVAPPQHGKSLIVSRFLPAYCLGKYPNRRVLHVSYNKEVISTMAKDVRKYMESESYSLAFPKSEIEGDGALTFRIKDKRGYYHAVGIGGPLTSYSGNYLIVDDPIKDAEEARSPRYRERLVDWYNKVLMTRTNSPWSVVVMATRWHVDDLTGFLLKNEPGEWTVAHFPQIQFDTGSMRSYDNRENGEGLWIDKSLPDDHFHELVARSKERTKETTVKRVTKVYIDEFDSRKKADPRTVTCMYQGKPTMAEGDTFKEEWFWKDSKRKKEINRYNSLEELVKKYPNLKPFQSWDFSGGSTSKTASYVAGNIFAFTDSGKLILYPFFEHGRMTNPEMAKAVIRLTERFPSAELKLVENKASGKATVQWLSGKVSGFTLFDPVGSKMERSEIASVKFDAQNFLIPTSELWPEVDDWINELLAFPSQPDDRVDNLSQACIYDNNLKLKKASKKSPISKRTRERFLARK